MAERRLTLLEAEGAALPLLALLQAVPSVTEVAAAGSLRRRRETVVDLDLVAAAWDGGAVIARFVAFPQVAKVMAQGETRATVRLRSGIQVDLRVVEEACFGAAGSTAHNIALRAVAVRKGWKLNDMGSSRAPSGSPPGRKATSTRRWALRSFRPSSARIAVRSEPPRTMPCPS